MQPEFAGDTCLDPVVLRRIFVENGILERENGGSSYWLATRAAPDTTANAANVANAANAANRTTEAATTAA